MRQLVFIVLVCSQLTPFKSTSAQTKYTLDKNLSLVEHVRSVCDQQEYIVSLFKARGLKGHYFFLTQASKGIIATFRFETSSIGPDFFYASTDTEFVIYFKNSLRVPKVLTFFKDGREPVLEDNKHYSYSDKPLFSYTYNDHYFIGKESKKEKAIILFEVIGNKVIRERKFSTDGQLVKQLKKMKAIENVFQDRKSNVNLETDAKNNIYKDSLVIVFTKLAKNANPKKYNVYQVKFDFATGTIVNRAILQVDYSKTIHTSLIDNKLFVIRGGADIERSNTVNYAEFAIYDATASKLLKEYRLEDSELGEAIFKTEIQNVSGDRFKGKKSATARAIDILRDEKYFYFDSYRTGSGNSVFKFVSKIYVTTPGPPGPNGIPSGGTTTLIDLEFFYVCFDASLEPCNYQLERTPYQIADGKRLTFKNENRGLEFLPTCSNNNSVFTFSFEKKTDEFIVTKFQ